MGESLKGIRVLVVEDDPMIGLLVEDILLDHRCQVDGPHITFAAGLYAALNGRLDIAVLDVNLGGTMSYPIADALAERGIPFVFTSGYGDGAAPDDHPDWPICAKPFNSDTLVGALRRLLA